MKDNVQIFFLNSSLFMVCIFALIESVYAKEIRVAVSLSIPPYAIQEKNAGREFDIVALALARAGYTMKPVYLPLGRIPTAIQRGEVDAAMTIAENSGLKNVFFSDSHISYQNVVISLAKNQFKIDSIADMTGHSVVAFQNASSYLGEDFKKMANTNPRYSEYAQQILQNMMLYSGRIEFVVADRHIFDYYNNEAQKRGANVTQEVVYHELFPATPNRVAFRDPLIRDTFNSSLQKMRQDGRYQTIIDKY